MRKYCHYYSIELSGNHTIFILEVSKILKNSIYQSTNYRSYLKDFYLEKKRLQGYTYRDFSQGAGMKSPSWLKELIEGKKNLTIESSKKAGKALGLSKTEQEYFELLVSFTQGSTSANKNEWYKKMLAMKMRLKLITVDAQQYEFYAKWYHPVVRSLVSKIDFAEDFKMLANHVVPKITPSEAKKSVKLLTKIGMIKKTRNGKWSQTQNAISTGDEVHSLNVVNYHKEVSRLAAEAHDRSDKEVREISAVTMGIDEETFLLIKKEIVASRKKIIKMANEAKKADRVYQLNFQLFPASKLGGAQA